jgi:hypothetical protein
MYESDYFPFTCRGRVFRRDADTEPEDLEPIREWEWREWRRTLNGEREINRMRELTSIGVRRQCARVLASAFPRETLDTYPKLSIEDLIKARKVGIVSARELEGAMAKRGTPLKQPSWKYRQGLRKADARQILHEIGDKLRGDYFLDAWHLSQELEEVCHVLAKERR